MIDCDVHNTWASVQELRPYLAAPFRKWFDEGEVPGTRPAFPAAHRPWLHPGDYKRTDATPAGGGAAGSDYDLMCRQLLDRYDMDYAILTGDELVVAPQDPAGAAAEIRRLGGHPRFAQVLVSSGSQRPYGDPFYHPIWDACAEVGLPLAAHLGGNAGVNAVPTGCGSPTFFWETHALLCETGMGHLASVIAHGVFEKWPQTRFVLIECGIAWVPALLWRLDEDYRALRKETPWLKRLPSEYARDHIRLSTQPLEQPRSRDALWPSLADIGAQDILLFASDYPHWDFDDPTVLRLPEDWREAILDTNARRLYGLPPCEPSRGDEVLAGDRAA